MYYEIKHGYLGSKDGTTVFQNAEETRFIAKAASEDAAYWISFEMNAPVLETYIMMPACAYDGNRFEAVERKYPPMYLESELGVNEPIRMTQVPRLEKEGDSKMEVTTGDLSVPCVCVYNKNQKEAFMVFFNQEDHDLNHGVTLEQIGDRLIITLRAPAKRSLVYRWYDGIPSLRENPEADKPLQVTEGEETIITHRVYTFPCKDIPELYRVFFEKRRELYHANPQANLPFSAYWELAEKHINIAYREINENEGFYTMLDNSTGEPRRSWGGGWCGDGMSSYAYIREGNALTIERSVKTLQWAARWQSEKTGFYREGGMNGLSYHGFGHHQDKKMMMVRSHSDIAYFMCKQILALEKMGVPVPDSLRKSVRMAADALISVWERYGQLGQLVNTETGELVMGGSTAGAIAPAALCGVAMITGEERYAEYAREIGRFFYRTATQIGVTTGGPGEILQAPDSESSAAMLESFAVLYEMNQTEEWLAYACDSAHQLASWVVPYDYKFPKDSRFGKMGILTAGSVWANVQNKHSAPGLCTLSPSAFLKIYRATGDLKYLEEMRQIAHFMPQTPSYPQRPMYTKLNCDFHGGPLHNSQMCERVNMSDWEGIHDVGDNITGSSYWPEASLALTWAEVPGVYVVPQRGVVCVSDHVNAWLENGKLMIQNPTEFPARVKVMVEDETTMKEPLGLDWYERFEFVEVPSMECVSVEIMAADGERKEV